jgi:nucleoside-diphosphate kinase
MDKTLILLKPDCLTGGKAGEVLKRFEEAGFQLLGCKMFRADASLLQEHYAHIASKPFFPEVQAFMQSTPLIAVALGGANAVDRVRELLGPTDSTKAPKGTIRGDFGVSVMKNMVHASDSPENAAIELQRFFKPEELFDYSMTLPA